MTYAEAVDIEGSIGELAWGKKKKATPVDVRTVSEVVESTFLGVGLEGLSAIDTVSESKQWGEIKYITLRFASGLGNILEKAGLEKDAVQSLIKKLASFYGESLMKIFNGDDVEGVVDQYVSNAESLLKQSGLSSNRQGRVRSISQIHLQEAAIFVRDIGNSPDEVE